MEKQKQMQKKMQMLKQQQQQKQKRQIPTISPTVDFIETEKNYNIAIELPGVSKESIDIELENGILTVSTGATVETKIEKDFPQMLTISSD